VNRTLLLVAVAAAALVATAAGLFFFLRTKPRSEPSEVLVVVPRSATAEKNETDVARVLEGELTGVAGLREHRSDSTASGVHLRLFLDAPKETTARAQGDEPALLAPVEKALAAAKAKLPPGVVVPPPVVARRTAGRIFLRADDIEARWLSEIKGAAATPACGGGGLRMVVEIDAPRLRAVGLDLPSVHHALATSAAVRAVQPGKNESLAALERAPLRPGAIPVLLRDVATVRVESPRRCVPVDGAPPFSHVVTASSPEAETAIRDGARAHGATVLREIDTLRVKIRFPPGTTREDKSRATSALVPRLRQVGGLELAGAIVSDDTHGELLFSVGPEPPTPERVTQLRGVFQSQPAIAWGGAVRGAALAKSRRERSAPGDRLRVILLGEDLDPLSDRASEIAQRLAKVEGVVALLDDGRERLPRFGYRADPARVQAQGLSEDDVAAAARIALEPDGVTIGQALEIRIMSPGQPSFEAERAAGAPLSSLITVTRELSRPSIRHVQGLRAIEPIWEVTPDPKLAGRVAAALVGLDATFRIEDDDEPPAPAAPTGIGSN